MSNIQTSEDMNSLDQQTIHQQEVDQQEIKDILRTYMLSAIMMPDLGDDTDLFESGVVNSLFAIQLMTFVEKRFAVEMESDDLDIENFRSLNATAAFVARKHQQNGR